MKKTMLFVVVLLASLGGFAQMRIGAGIQFVGSGSIQIVMSDIDFVNDGTFLPGNSQVKFTGNTNNKIGGNAITSFNDLEIAKAGINKVSLEKNIYISSRIIFTSGLLDLNNRDAELNTTAYLQNESNSSRAIGPLGGELVINSMMNAPNAVNAGNLGAIITSPSNLGAVIIRRGHKNQSGTGMTSAIHRYYDITPANNAGLNASFRFHYFDAELNNQAENALVLFRSMDAGSNWTNENFTTRDINLNYVEKTGVNSFSRWALSSPGVISAPDLTSSQFFSTTQLTQGTVADECIVIRNVGNAPTSAPISFTITNYNVLSGLTVSMNNAQSVTIGIDNYPLDNINWIFDPNTSTITSNIGVVIPPGGSRNIGLKITRGVGMQAGANGSVTQTTTITAGTGGGDQYFLNNSISNTLLKN